MAVASIGPTHMPMATSMAMPAAMPTLQPTPTFDSTIGGPSQPSDAASMLWDHGGGGDGVGVGIGIDLDCDRIRVAVWSAEDGRSVPLFSIPCQVAFASPSKALVGDDAAAATAEASDNTPVPLVGVQRLLGRSYASLAGAKWLEQEAEDCIGAELIPAGATAQASDEEEDDGAADAGVRLRLTFKRAAPSGLKKRGGASAGDGKKPRSTTIERVLAPEEVLSKLLIAAKQRAEASVDAEVTHATVAVPAHWGLAQRRATFDGCLLAGLTPLAVVGHPVALLAGGLLSRTSSPPLALADAADGAPLLMVEWGAGSCSAAVFRRAGETFALAGVDGADGAGGLALDRLIAKRLARDLSSRIACEGVDLTSRASRVELIAAAGRLREGLSVWRGSAAATATATAPPAAAATAETMVHLYDGGGPIEVCAELTAAEWREAVENALHAVGAMVAELMAHCGIEAGSKVAVHVGGVVAACAPAHHLLERTLAPWRCALAWAADGDGDGDGDGDSSEDGREDGGEDGVFGRADAASEGGVRVGGGGCGGSHEAACGAARLAAHQLQKEVQTLIGWNPTTTPLPQMSLASYMIDRRNAIIVWAGRREGLARRALV